MVDAYTNLFNEAVEHSKGTIKRGRTIRKFYYDDSETKYPDFINSL